MFFGCSRGSDVGARHAINPTTSARVRDGKKNVSAPIFARRASLCFSPNSFCLFVSSFLFFSSFWRALNKYGLRRCRFQRVFFVSSALLFGEHAYWNPVRVSRPLVGPYGLVAWPVQCSLGGWPSTACTAAQKGISLSETKCSDSIFFFLV